jgi:K+:H+ antiporter
MDFWHVLFDILILLSAALLFGVVCERFKQSAILGYLAAGTLLGPGSLGLVGSGEQVEDLAELGVALLLFTIGLEFSWPRLKKLGIAALGGGASQVLITLGLAGGVGLVFGFSVQSSIAIGAVVALSSTAVVLRVLVSRSEMESSHGRYALGVLLMQDIAVVPLVLIVSVLGGDGTGEGAVSFGAIAVVMGRALLAGVGLVISLVVLLNWVMPRFLGMSELQRNRDLPILLAIVIGMGSAWVSHQLGLSPALGAFVAGMILAESPFATQIRSDVTSLRTLLVTLFFSSIGMFGDPVWFFSHLPIVIGLVVAIVLGKALIVWISLRMFGVPNRKALAAGICLAQVGEFSFVIAAAAHGTLIDDELFKLIISSTIVTLFLTPYLVAMSRGLAAKGVGSLERIGLVKEVASGDELEINTDTGLVMIIGFGPAGHAVGGLIEGSCERVLVVDMNQKMIADARAMGFSAHIGDGTQAEVLEHAGAGQAKAVIVTVPDPVASMTVISMVRAIAPDAHIIARARYNRHIDEIEASGAHEVLDEETLVGVHLAEQLSAFLGSEDSEALDAE